MVAASTRSATGARQACQGRLRVQGLIGPAPELPDDAGYLRPLHAACYRIEAARERAFRCRSRDRRQPAGACGPSPGGSSSPSGLVTPPAPRAPTVCSACRTLVHIDFATRHEVAERVVGVRVFEPCVNFSSGPPLPRRLPATPPAGTCPTVAAGATAAGFIEPLGQRLNGVAGTPFSLKGPTRAALGKLAHRPQKSFGSDHSD